MESSETERERGERECKGRQVYFLFCFCCTPQFCHVKDSMLDGDSKEDDGKGGNEGKGRIG